MAASPMQLHKLIKRLVEKTTQRAISWEPSATGNSFRTRIGDYVVQIEMGMVRALGSQPEPGLTVTKLDGGHVANTGTGLNALFQGSTTAIQPGTQKMLDDLWNMIVNRDDDIDRLLHQLG